jgi:competence protein ComEC
LPAIPFAMAIGSVAVLGGLIYLILGQTIGWFVWLVLSYIIKVVEFLAAIPWASGEAGKMHWIFLIIFYLLVGWFIWYKTQEGKKVNV